MSVTTLPYDLSIFPYLNAAPSLPHLNVANSSFKSLLRFNHSFLLCHIAVRKNEIEKKKENGRNL